jgi:hypothetical protein
LNISTMSCIGWRESILGREFDKVVHLSNFLIWLEYRQTNEFRGDEYGD